ncbi:MAG: FAD-dependent oxidoreductase [Alphaproteobacteria bacterium]|nr:FAD-dependent oxidoreductase [Alphaproteobacteria bacterium]
MKIVIAGGGAGGASCAARLRRLDAAAEIIVLEKTAETSIASCGLPYYIGGVIGDRGEMQAVDPQAFGDLFRVDMRLNTALARVHPAEKIVETTAGERIPYDKLVLALGARPFVPDIPGLDTMPHFVVKRLADADAIKAHIAARHPKSAVVIGGGFIGVEVAENLARLGIKTALAEMAEQVLPPLDTDIVCQIHAHLRAGGVRLALGDGVREISGKAVVLAGGLKIPAEMVVVAAGIRPDTDAVKGTGIRLTKSGAIRTDAFMRTSLPDVYACGDCAAVRDFVSGREEAVALAGPANRQGRLIADHIAGGAPYPYGGTQGTGVVKAFDLTAAFTGNNEKQLRQSKTAYGKMIVWGNDHAGYYPGASPLTLKILYGPADGRILGAQAVGRAGADKRIDIIATIMRLNGTTADLRDAELCYAPPYAGAKDLVNMIGMAIENARQGLSRPFFGTDFAGMAVVDVRPPAAYRKNRLPGAINIPAAQLGRRMGELPKDKPILLYCFRGYTSYVAARILMANGFKNVFSYAGGIHQYLAETGG